MQLAYETGVCKLRRSEGFNTYPIPGLICISRKKKLLDAWKIIDMEFKNTFWKMNVLSPHIFEKMAFRINIPAVLLQELDKYSISCSNKMFWRKPCKNQYKMNKVGVTVYKVPARHTLTALITAVIDNNL